MSSIFSQEDHDRQADPIHIMDSSSECNKGCLQDESSQNEDVKYPEIKFYGINSEGNAVVVVNDDNHPLEIEKDTDQIKDLMYCEKKISFDVLKIQEESIEIEGESRKFVILKERQVFSKKSSKNFAFYSKCANYEENTVILIINNSVYQASLKDDFLVESDSNEKAVVKILSIRNDCIVMEVLHGYGCQRETIEIKILKGDVLKRRINIFKEKKDILFKDKHGNVVRMKIKGKVVDCDLSREVILWSLDDGAVSVKKVPIIENKQLFMNFLKENERCFIIIPVSSNKKCIYLNIIVPFAAESIKCRIMKS